MTKRSRVSLNFILGIVLTASTWTFFLGTTSLAQTTDPAVPDKSTTYALIYETLLSVNNATRTNNYSVLRSMASPAFRQRFTQEQLEQAFSVLSKKSINLRPVVLLKPEISKVQFIKKQNLLSVRGHMPTLPVRLNFEFHYQYLEGTWRLFALSLNFKGRPTEAQNRLKLGTRT